MNKFKKIGLTALATSLVASSAYAAEVSVSGAAGVTYSTSTGNSGDASDHGKGRKPGHSGNCRALRVAESVARQPPAGFPPLARHLLQSHW